MTLTRNPGETWLDALLRVAREGEQEDEARAAYWRLRDQGDSDRESACSALELCGLVELADEVEARC